MGELERYIGAALRHLRLHGGSAPRKQMDVAAEAGVTRGMLSSYERGRQEPSLKNLDRVLQALGADLAQLHWAIRIVQTAPTVSAAKGGSGAAAGGPEAAPRPGAAGKLPTAGWDFTPPPPAELHEPGAVYRAVRLPEPLSEDEEAALGQLLSGFLAWLRYTRGRADESDD